MILPTNGAISDHPPPHLSDLASLRLNARAVAGGKTRDGMDQLSARSLARRRPERWVQHTIWPSQTKTVEPDPTGPDER